MQGADALDDAGRKALATALINAGAVLPSPEQRVELARSLNLDEQLQPDRLVPESGRLLGLLIEADLVPDDVETFTSDMVVDWQTREFAIHKSSDIAVFLSPDVLPAEDLVPFLSSSLVPATLKMTVLRHPTDYVEGDRARAGAMARYALANNIALTADQLEALRSAGAPDTLVVALVGEASTMATDDVRSLLRRMRPPYQSIADPGTARPSVPDDPAHRSLLERLRSAGVVSSYASKKGRLVVSLRRA
jgi:hypothetical protein